MSSAPVLVHAVGRRLESRGPMGVGRSGLRTHVVSTDLTFVLSVLLLQTSEMRKESATSARPPYSTMARRPARRPSRTSSPSFDGGLGGRLRVGVRTSGSSGQVASLALSSAASGLRFGARRPGSSAQHVTGRTWAIAAALACPSLGPRSVELRERSVRGSARWPGFRSWRASTGRWAEG
jgi:hypothetical protein